MLIMNQIILESAALNMMQKNMQRRHVQPGMKVEIVLKKDQRSGIRTTGVVQDILTNKSTHTRGIKVRLTDGQVGRVQKIL